MTEGTELMPVAAESNPKQLAKAFAASGYFGDVHKISQALVKIAAGQELGLGPMASMTGIHLIEGEISLGANLLAALIRRSESYDYEMIELTPQKCSIRFSRNGKVLKPDSEFSLQDAQIAGVLKPRSGWEKYPRNMLFARAISNGFRWHCPELGGGTPLYTLEDFGQVTEGEFKEIEKPEETEEAEEANLEHLEIDPNSTSPEIEEEKPLEVEPEQPALNLNGGETMTPTQVKDFIRVSLDMHKGKRTHPDLIKNVAWQLGECFTGMDDPDAERHRVMYFLFKAESTKDLTGAELMATLDWLRAKKGHDEKWHPNALAAQEARAIAQTFEEAE